MYSDPERAISYLDSAVYYSRRSGRWEDFFLGHLDRIDQFIFMENPTRARENLELADSLLQLPECSDLPRDVWYENHSYWGEYYHQIGYFEKALEIFEETVAFLKAGSQLNARNKCFQIYRVNAYIADLYSKMGQYQNALEQYFGNISYFECYRGADLDHDSPSYFATNYKLIGDAYLNRGDTVKALQYYRQAEQDLDAIIKEQGLEVTWYYSWAKKIYSALARAYLGNPSQAREYLDKAILFHQGEEDPDWIYTHKLFSEIYIAEKDYDRAEAVLNKALQKIQIHYGDKFYENARILHALGKIKTSQGELSAALDLYKQAARSLVPDGEQKQSDGLPDPEQVTSKKDLLLVLSSHLDALLLQYDKTGEEKCLNSGRRLASYAVSLIDQIREDFWLDIDKENLIQLSYDIYGKGIEFAALSGKEYFSEGFWIAEKSKALTLLEAFKNARIEEVKNISPDILEFEQRLRHEISYLEENFKKEQSKREQNTEKLQRIHENIIQLRKNLDKLYEEMSSRNEHFAQFVHSREALTAWEVQKELINRQQTLIEYFFGDQRIYRFLINKGELELVRIEPSIDFHEVVGQLRQGLFGYYLSADSTDLDLDSLFQASNDLLLTASRKLYQNLLQPVADKISEELIIIPDGVLNYVPFGVLLTDSRPVTANNFKRRPYLINKHVISYCYSATLLSEMREKAVDPELDILAFAPSFPSRSGPSTSLVAQRGPVFDTLYYNIDEVHAIRNIFGVGDVRTQEAATKAAFLSTSSNCPIVHIASHAFLNDSASEYSYIVFTKTPEASENRLYVRDLYNMRLKAALVVLSACETGIGELRKGEGLISIARGFSYAGAKSILTTLWPVNDASTTEIIRSFYGHLKKGRSKSEAIRLAKMEYLSHQIDPGEAHPFFWAAYIPIGDMHPVAGGWLLRWRSILGWSLLLLTGIMGLGIAFHWFGRR